MCIIGHGPSIEVCVLVDTCLTLRVDELDPIAEVTFNSLMRDHRDVGWQGLTMKWQDLSVNPRTCPRGNMPRLYTYDAWSARPATTHCKTIFKLALSNKSVQALPRFRMGCHNLPRDKGKN